ncbi:hypothetical protein [Xanthobacter aminoxidans]|uniref:hypothetical protein n=1 Tax=Xanthobacter aminoxidans TaxID=186280 RepID=UPI002022EAEA|nr:hypothetical protein [Xanthobacter aminoxidans]MCL8382052.1 hypothetical protein [Xanthobacter aminoxidans]
MGVKLNSVKVNIDLETSGTWIESTSYPGVSYLVRGIHYQPFETARDLGAQALAKTYRTKPVPLAERNAVLGSAIAKHLLLDWKGFDEDHDPSRALEMLTDPAFRTLLDDVLQASTAVGKQDLEFTETLAKN